ncbi:OCT1 Mitochondrial intermediate peptidase [Candida maltosa Xu316]
MKPTVSLLRCYRHIPSTLYLASRHLSTATTSISPVPSEEYQHIRQIFDSQKYFDKFTRSGTKGSLFDLNKTGLFKNEYLTTPAGLAEFSKSSLKEAKKLVNEMLSDVDTVDGKLKYIKKLDQLSDILCRVIDVAELIRVIHPNSSWVNAAQQTHEIMFEYMNQLNTNVELCTNLRDILHDPALARRLSDEEIKVGEYLKQDFERSGIYMDPETRDNFVTISQEISLLGSKFTNQINELETYWCSVTISEWESIKDKNLKDRIKKYQWEFPGTRDKNYIQFPLVSDIPFQILTDCECESLRKKVWVALHNSPVEQVDILNKFVTYRAILAKMLRYDSFAHYQLEHKMAKNPENVITFLSNLQTSLKNKGVLKELTKLSEIKHDGVASEDVIEDIKPWDKDFLLGKLQSKIEESESVLAPIENHFSVGTIIAGLNKLFQSLYNISLVPVPALPGETWNSTDVRKLAVVDNSTGKKTLGYLYLDFWSEKALPSHFTVVCSRRLNTSIGSESTAQMKRLVQLDEKEDYQLPVVTVACNLSKSGQQETPTLLTLDQVDTIFHEMGHAMHSMIGRTELHNLSGTRCSTDFVELPSVLMESFSRDPRVMHEIGRHYITNEKLDHEHLEFFHKRRAVLDACETFIQSKMALLDQKLHNEDIVKSLEKGFDAVDSSVIYHNLEAELKVLSDTLSTWHGKFPHLFSYGAVYYSYLLDRAIADKIWQGLFAADPWDSAAGQKYKNSILKWGGTRDPWECLAEALDNEELKKGDANAMQIIGQDSNL